MRCVDVQVDLCPLHQFRDRNDAGFVPPRSCLFLSLLSQMILDKKLRGTLDQGAGCLEIFDVSMPDKVYPTSLEIFDSLGKVVDTLFNRSQKIVAV